MQLPQGPPPHPHQTPAMPGINVRARCLWLNTVQHCHSSCGKAMTGTSSNKSHLCHQQLWMVAHPDQHQPNRQSCQDTAVQTTHAVCNDWMMQTAHLWRDKLCLASPLELQPSTMVGTKAHARVRPYPKPAKGVSKCWARQWIPDPNNTPPALKSSAQLP